MMFESTRDFMRVHGAMVTHDTILPGRLITKRKGMREVADDICAKYGITFAQLIGPSHKPKYAIPRQEGYLRSRELGYLSYQRIGDFFGGRDHSTVMTGCKRAAEREANGD